MLSLDAFLKGQWDFSAEKSNIHIRTQISLRLMPESLNMEELSTVIPPSTFREFLERERKILGERYD